MDTYELVVGLEIHAQMDTKSKLFCSCDNESFGAEPNVHTCPVCQGFPGVLPVSNETAIEYGVRTAHALNLEVQTHSKFDRKNYFYPDLPMGYQISQYDEPISLNGHLDFMVDGKETHIGITRMHIECDAGKLTHSEDGSLLDFNRSGTPLMEIVTEPDFRNTAQVKAFLQELQKILRTIKVSRADMEKGHMRCDANVSLRKKGSATFGTRCEIKNLNSFTNVVDAIKYEATRQYEILENGGEIDQETRGWDVERQFTYTMRSKEDAHDYRYFPEPDLPPVELTREYIESIRESLPELPLARQARFVSQYKIKEDDARTLSSDAALADYFEQVVEVSQDAKKSANWVLSELLGKMNEDKIHFSELKISAQDLGDIIARINSGEISGKIAKTVFEEVYLSGQSPAKVIESQGLKQVSDSAELEKMVQRVLDENPENVQKYKDGYDKLFGFFVGQVMKVSQGQANPQKVNEILKEKLGV